MAVRNNYDQFDFDSARGCTSTRYKIPFDNFFAEKQSCRQFSMLSKSVFLKCFIVSRERFAGKTKNFWRYDVCSAHGVVNFTWYYLLARRDIDEFINVLRLKRTPRAPLVLWAHNNRRHKSINNCIFLSFSLSILTLLRQVYWLT